MITTQFAKGAVGSCVLVGFIQLSFGSGVRIPQEKRIPLRHGGWILNVRLDSMPKGEPSSTSAASADPVGPGERGVLLTFSLKGISALRPGRTQGTSRSALVQAKLDNLNYWASSSSQDDDSFDISFEFAVNKKQSTADFSIGVGAGAYREVAASHRILYDRTAGYNKAKPTGPHDLAITCGDGMIFFAVPKEAVGKQLMLRAFDASGKPLFLGADQDLDVRNMPGGLTGNVGYEKLPKGVDHFTLEARDYEWVTLKGVPLHPSGSSKP